MQPHMPQITQQQEPHEPYLQQHEHHRPELIHHEPVHLANSADGLAVWLNNLHLQKNAVVVASFGYSSQKERQRTEIKKKDLSKGSLSRYSSTCIFLKTGEEQVKDCKSWTPKSSRPKRSKCSFEHNSSKKGEAMDKDQGFLLPEDMLLTLLVFRSE